MLEIEIAIKAVVVLFTTKLILDYLINQFKSIL